MGRLYPPPCPPARFLRQVSLTEAIGPRQNRTAPRSRRLPRPRLPGQPLRTCRAALRLGYGASPTGLRLVRRLVRPAAVGGAVRSTTCRGSALWCPFTPSVTRSFLGQ